MLRPTLDLLKRPLLAPLLPVGCIAFVAVGLAATLVVEAVHTGPRQPWWIPPLPLVLVYVFYRTRPEAWKPVRLWCCAWRMRTVSAAGLRIHYARQVERFATAEQLTQMVRAEVDDLQAWLQAEPPTAVVVFILPTERALRWAAGNGYGAWADTRMNYIVVSCESADEFRRQVRHELTHILTSRPADDVPELNVEGVATFFHMLPHGVRDIGRWTLYRPEKSLPLRSLLAPGMFHEPAAVQLNYTTAGTFTAFLIREYGWETYWAFYRKATRWTYSAAFEETFGASLEAVEQDWLRIAQPYPESTESGPGCSARTPDAIE